MQQLLTSLITALICLIGWRSDAANTEASLHFETKTAKPGDTVWAAVLLEMAPEWHTYWKNAGEGGIGVPTKITWQLPPGVTAGEIHWPTPEKHVVQTPAETNTTYVFHNSAALLVPLTLAPTVAPGSLNLTGRVVWIECKQSCIQGRASVTGTLLVADKTELAAETKFAEWRKKLPPEAPSEFQPKASWEKGARDDKRPLIIEWSYAEKFDSADFFPGPGENFDVSGLTDALTAGAGKIRLRKTFSKFDGDWPKEISGLLVIKSGTNITTWDAKIPIGAATRGGAAVAPTEGAAPNVDASANATPSLAQMLLYAFLGGMILNIMPCVLPVIALKILGFVTQAQQSPARVRQLGFIYGAGVLVSFLALAALVIGVKAAGHKAGWGMQFSNPLFIVFLTALVTLVALNLFGVFEVTLGGRTMDTASGLAAQHGASGAFFNGVLATVLATPCTAPFLGVALGFAFVQPAHIIVLMFLAVGVGLAAPYVVLACQPKWLKFLPKPGAWMEKFKIAMGFPMLATALWLASLATSFYGDRTWWLGVFLVFVGAAAWVFGDFFQRGSRRRGLALVVVILLLGLGGWWPLEAGLRWRAPGVEANAGKTVAHAPEGYAWASWSPEAVAKARAEGRPVIVDFTARWCQTCNISVKPGLEAESVIAKLKQLNAVALVADYTLFPDNITEELEKHNRNGVPLVLVYPRDASQPPVVLPEPLPFPAPFAPIVLAALNKI